MSLLELQDVSVFYGDFQALFSISLTVEEGQTFAVIGANGAGKSTMLKTVAGVLRPRSGRVLFEGEPVDQVSAHKRVSMGISMVPEGRRVFPSLTVEENLHIGAYGGRKGDWNLGRSTSSFRSSNRCRSASRQASRVGNSRRSPSAGR